MAQLEEKIVFIQNEGNQFLKYYDGTEYYDEDEFGRPNPQMNHTYLDNNLNSWIIDVSKDNIQLFLEKFSDDDIPAFIGPHSPETIAYDPKTGKESIVPNTNPNTVGIWRTTTKEEKQKYRALLDNSKISKNIKLAMTMPKDE